MIFKNFVEQDWIRFNFIRSGLDSTEISQSAHLWSIEYKHTQSAQYRLIKTDTTERLIASLEVEQ